MNEPMAPEGKLDLAAATAFHAELVARLGQDIVIDFEQVSQIGSLCLQSCIAAARESQATQTCFEIINVSAPVAAQLAVMGFTPETLAEGCT